MDRLFILLGALLSWDNGTQIAQSDWSAIFKNIGLSTFKFLLILKLSTNYLFRRTIIFFKYPRKKYLHQIGLETTRA